MNALRALFPWAAGRAAPPLRLAAFVFVLALASLAHDGTSEFADGRDLEGVRFAWIGVVATCVAFVAPGAGWWLRWMRTDRLWFASRPVAPAVWFATAFLAQLAATALGLALLTASLAHLGAAERPASRRVARVELARTSLVAGGTGELLRLGSGATRGVLHVPVLAVNGTGSPPRVRLVGGSGAVGPEATVLGRERLRLELAVPESEVRLERTDGTALVVAPVAPLEVFAPGASRAEVLVGFLLGTLAWCVLPLASVLALGRWLRPALAVGAVLASGVVAARFGLAPLGGLTDALHLLEWNAVDHGATLRELPRVAVGLVLFALACARPLGAEVST